MNDGVRGGGAEGIEGTERRKSEVESERMKYGGVSGWQNFEKEEWAERARQRRAERRRGRRDGASLLGNGGKKADTRREAARKFYCRSVRGFHLQIPPSFPFLDRNSSRGMPARRGTGKKSGNVAPASFPRAYACRNVREVSGNS